MLVSPIAFNSAVEVQMVKIGSVCQSKLFALCQGTVSEREENMVSQSSSKVIPQ